MPRGRPRKNPVKIPVYPEPDVRAFPCITVTWGNGETSDIRENGQKSDQELLNDWFYYQEMIDAIVPPTISAPDARKMQEAIELELGTDRIQDERLRRLEEGIREAESKMKAIPVLAIGLVAILVLQTILRFF